MAEGSIHTVYRAGRWVNEVEDGPVISAHHTQSEAERSGREEAARRGTDHVVHRVGGEIVRRESFGGEPSPSRS